MSNVFNPKNTLRFALSARVITSTLLHFGGRQLSEKPGPRPRSKVAPSESCVSVRA